MQDVLTFLSNHLYLTSGAAIALVLVFFIEIIRIRQRVGGLSPDAAIQFINHEHAAILDIRTINQYQEGHIVHAHHITPEDLTTGKKMDKFKQKPFLIVCQDGVKSRQLAQKLSEHHRAHSLQGGMQAWHEAKLPVVKETSQHG